MRGTDAFSPVTDDYDPWDNDFTGTINKIVIRLDDHPRDSAARLQELSNYRLVHRCANPRLAYSHLARRPILRPDTWPSGGSRVRACADARSRADPRMDHIYSERGVGPIVSK